MSNHVRLWNDAKKKYVSSAADFCGTVSMEQSTGCFDRKGREIFFNDRVALFSEREDNFIGVFDVTSHSLFNLTPTAKDSGIFDLSLLGDKNRHYWFEVVGNVHVHENPETVQQFLAKSLRNE